MSLHHDPTPTCTPTRALGRIPTGPSIRVLSRQRARNQTGSSILPAVSSVPVRIVIFVSIVVPRDASAELDVKLARRVHRVRSGGEGGDGAWGLACRSGGHDGGGERRKEVEFEAIWRDVFRLSSLASCIDNNNLPLFISTLFISKYISTDCIIAAQYASPDSSVSPCISNQRALLISRTSRLATALHMRICLWHSHWLLLATC